PERGPTDLDNLVLVCSFHHRLVHEHCWEVRLEPNGVATWLRPDGRTYSPGVPVPQESIERAPPIPELVLTS
ncbi:MAG: HNH endonuclease signature motif containing protein, partial [Actinomycetota bacterium]